MPRPRLQPLAAAALLALGATAAAAPVNWVGANDAFWDQAGNWSPGLPGASDDALLGGANTIFRSGTVSVRSFTGSGRLRITGGALSFAQPSNIGALELQGGTLGGAGTLAVAGASSWTGGELVGSGSTTMAGALTISGNAANKHLRNGHTLTLNSDTFWSGSGNIGFWNGSSIVNNGSFTDTGPNHALSVSTGGGSFVNNGSFVRNGTSTITTVATSFINSGSVSVQAGGLYLYGGGSSSGGSFNVAAAGAALQFSGTHSLTNTTGTGPGAWTVVGGTTTVNGTLDFSGTFGVTTGATLTIAGNANVGRWHQSGGIRGGSGTLAVAGPSTWGGGELVGAGSTTMAGALTISGDTAKQLRDGHTLTLNGDTTWGGSGNIGFWNGSSIVNNGSFTDTGPSRALSVSTGGGNFINNGSFVRSGIGTTTVATGFSNGGSVNVQAGTLYLGGGGSSSGGSFNVAEGTTLQFSGTHSLTNTTGTGPGTWTVVGGSTTVNGTLDFSGIFGVATGGTLTIAGNANVGGWHQSGGIRGGSGMLTASGPSTWSGGELIGPGSTTVAGSLAISGTAANKHLRDGHTLTLNGDTTWDGAGNIGFWNGSSIVNNGSFTDTGPNHALSVGTGGGSFINNGSFVRNGTGTTTVATSFINSGSITVQAGALHLGGGFTGSGNASTSGSGVLVIGAASTVGTLTNNGSSAGALALGANTITVSGDYTNAHWGSGNEFNRRANVAGSGQILAAGDARQVISGANVSGGDTATATLTIGNVHVGSTAYHYTIANGDTTGPMLRGALQTAVNGATLNDARLSGSGASAGNYDGATQTVVFTAGSAGALAPMSGQVLNLRSNFDNIADQKLHIVLSSGAAAYSLASGHTATPVIVANQRVGGSNTAALDVSNTAASGSFSEDLNATVTSVAGAATTSGAVSGLLAGTSGGGIQVGVSTATAGAQSGTVNLSYTSAGTVAGASNGLGLTDAGGQAVAVTGNVYQAASGQLVGHTLNFGTLQVGQQISQDLVVRNTATGPAGFVEDLNASFGTSGNGQISGSGALNGITAGQASTAANGTMTVTVNGTTAGALNSGIAVNYTSAGAVNGVSNGLGLLAVGSESFNVNGTISAVASVINAASPQFGNTSIDLGAVRVGAVSPTAHITLANQATAAPQAALNASISSSGAPVSASGSVSLLAPGASSTALQVGLNTAVAGNYTGANAGSATVTLVSDAANVGGCAPNCEMALAPQQITVSGKVYTAAVGQAGTSVVDFGIVRVGDTVSAKDITIHNAAAVTALNDTLQASVGGLGGAFTPGAAVSGIAAGGSGTLSVGLNTASAGIFSQTGSVGFLSQNMDMADVSAGADAAVLVTAQVNNLANAEFDLLAGAGLLSDDGLGHFTLNLGSIALGSNGLWSLQLGNKVGGPADLLRGLFDLTGADDFALSGWDAFGDLAGGEAFGDLAITFEADRLGSFDDTVVFNGFSFNASDTDGLAQVRSLRIVASVFDPDAGGGTVPAPGTLLLVTAALLAALRARQSTRQRARQGVPA